MKFPRSFLFVLKISVFVAMLQFIALNVYGQFVHDAIDPEFRFGSLKYNPEFQPFFELQPILPDSGQVVTVTEEDELVLDTIFRIHRKSKELFLFERRGREFYKYYRMSLPIDSCIQLFKNNYDYYTVVGTDGYLIADEFSVKQMKFDTSGICCSYDVDYKSDTRSGKSIFHKDSIQIFDNNRLVYTLHHDNFGNIDSISDNYYKMQFSKVVFLRHPFYNTLTIEEYSLNRKSKTDVLFETETFTYDKLGRLSYLVANKGFKSTNWYELYNYLYLDNGNVDCIRCYPTQTRIVHYTVESSGALIPDNNSVITKHSKMRELTKLTQSFPVSESDFMPLEELIGQKLPLELKDLFYEYAGSSVLEKVVPPGDYFSLDWFVLITPRYQNCPTIIQYYESVQWYMDAIAEDPGETMLPLIQSKWVPFARSEEDLFCYQLSGIGAGRIYALKDEMRGRDDTFVFIANSLEEFLNSLYTE